MSDNAVVAGVLNVILCGCSGFGLYKCSPTEHPFGFTACLLGLTYGLCGLCAGCITDDAKNVKEKLDVVMELIPLPLVNIDLYLMAESNNIALGHGVFIIPLAFDAILKFFKEGGEDASKDTLIHLTILGNVTSLLYLAINEGSYLYGGMAVVAFLTKYGAMLAEDKSEGTGAPLSLIGYSAFFLMAGFALGAEGK